jgi:NodT family efflux transporter outer membrane factor (OMF) lipoprotein
MTFIEQSLKLFPLRYLGFIIAAFVLAGCAAKRSQYDVPLVPLPNSYSKMPVEVDAATDSKNIPAPSPAADSKPVETADSNPSENKQKIEKRMVKTTAAMLSDAFFKFDSDQLTPEAKTALNSVAETLRNAGYSGNIHLTGHTCNIGTAKYNQKLSERRALSIKKYLAETGVVPSETIVAEGQGENNPRYPNTKELRFKNRRVDLEFVTFTDKLDDVALPSDPEQAKAAKPKRSAKVEWAREYIDAEPSWLTSDQGNATSAKQPVAANDKSVAPSGIQANSVEQPAAPTTPLGDVLGEWWRLLGSNELDALMDRALANNHDLRIAAYRLAQAEARAGQASADRIPTITIPVEVNNQYPYFGVGSVTAGNQSSSKRIYKASIRGDWRLDVWGERQSLFEASDFQLWGATFQRDDVQRTMVATVASVYVEYLSLNDRLRVARETEGVLSGMVDSTDQRMQKGDATIIDLEQMRTAVYAVRATIPVIELQREQALDYIAWLVGAVPGTLALSERGLDSLSYPAVLPGMPSSLLLRRPDVRLIEAQLLANDANVDVARTRVLPPLDLTAQVGYGSLIFSQWFQPENLFWSGIANLSATIFDSGKLSKEVDYANAVHEELVESYVRVIYGAVREVEDSLMNVRKMGKRLQAEQESVNAARRAYDFSSESYAAGAIDHLVLLDTERTYHSKLDELHQVAMSRYHGLIQLFSALGGGVRQGEALPGKGLRPVMPLETGAVMVSAPQVLSMDGVDFANSLLDGNDELWLAELPAVYDTASIGATLRDLRGRFPKLMEDRSLLPRQMGRVEDADKERAAWYRLFVAKFKDSKGADEFCAELSASQMRCRSVSSRSKEFLEGTIAPAKVVPAATQTPATEPDVPPAQAVSDVSRKAEDAPQQTELRQVAPSAVAESEPAAEPVAAPVQAADAPSTADIPVQQPASGIAAAEPGSTVPKPEAEASPEQPFAAGSASSHGYAVQLGTFADQDRADKAVASMQKKGYPAYIYKTDGSQGRAWFTVRLGNFPQRSDASAMADSIRKKVKIKAVPVPIVLNGDSNIIAMGALHASGGGN